MTASLAATAAASVRAWVSTAGPFPAASRAISMSTAETVCVWLQLLVGQVSGCVRVCVCGCVRARARALAHICMQQLNTLYSAEGAPPFAAPYLVYPARQREQLQLEAEI